MTKHMAPASLITTTQRIRNASSTAKRTSGPPRCGSALPIDSSTFPSDSHALFTCSQQFL
ncbi:hypothetical protein BBOMB_0081 [Bifidobacterium bombi DSM 19703]|uniref:Uncharacterized protein n=1 Tax=Bifidobacterium bombi DSM 19703 TaxID=1341695 RepID=A0A080N1S9_9BIFI|nr:hypothetical protein BBOMB_0081 [Bifidobacterium bombi DSM 19703]